MWLNVTRTWLINKCLLSSHDTKHSGEVESITANLRKTHNSSQSNTAVIGDSCLKLISINMEEGIHSTGCGSRRDFFTVVMLSVDLSFLPSRSLCTSLRDEI